MLNIHTLQRSAPRVQVTPLTANESHAPHSLIQPLPAPDEVWDEVFALDAHAAP